MGTLAQLEDRRNQSGDPSFQSIYFMPKYNQKRKDEWITQFPYAENYIRFLKEFPLLMSKRAEEENKSVNPSGEPSPKRFGREEPQGFNGSFYTDPGPRNGQSPEHLFYMQYFNEYDDKAGFKGTIQSNDGRNYTLTTGQGTHYEKGTWINVGNEFIQVEAVAGDVVTMESEFQQNTGEFRALGTCIADDNSTRYLLTVHDTTGVKIGHPIRINDDVDEARCVFKVDHVAKTIEVNIPFEEKPSRFDPVEFGHRFARNPLNKTVSHYTVLARSGSTAAMLNNTYTKTFSTEAANENRLESQFSMECLSVRDVRESGFMRIATPFPDAPDVTDLFSTAGAKTIKVDGTFSEGATEFNINDGEDTPAPITNAVPVGYIAELPNGQQYHTAVNTDQSKIVIADNGGLAAAINSGDVVIIRALGNGQYNRALNNAITLSGNVVKGAKEFPISTLTHAPKKGKLFAVEGRLYETDDGCTTDSLKITTEAHTDYSSGVNLHFATWGTIGLDDATVVDPRLPIVNQDTNEIMWAGGGGAMAIVNGMRQHKDWDYVSGVNTIKGWRGVFALPQSNTNYDLLDPYFPEVSYVEPIGIQQAEDGGTRIDDTLIRASRVKMDFNPGVEANATAREGDQQGLAKKGDVVNQMECDPEAKSYIIRQTKLGLKGKTFAAQQLIGLTLYNQVIGYAPHSNLGEGDRSVNKNETDTKLMLYPFGKDGYRSMYWGFI